MTLKHKTEETGLKTEELNIHSVYSTLYIVINNRSKSMRSGS